MSIFLRCSPYKNAACVRTHDVLDFPVHGHKYLSFNMRDGKYDTCE